MVILHVNDMNCQHCVKTIEQALKEANVDGTISLDNKSITIKQTSDVEAAMAAVSNAGFTPSF